MIMYASQEGLQPLTDRQWHISSCARWLVVKLLSFVLEFKLLSNIVKISSEKKIQENWWSNINSLYFFSTLVSIYICIYILTTMLLFSSSICYGIQNFKRGNFSFNLNTISLVCTVYRINSSTRSFISANCHDFRAIEFYFYYYAHSLMILWSSIQLNFIA